MTRPTRHVIVFAGGGPDWHIEHPATCSADLEALCHVERAAERTLPDGVNYTAGRLYADVSAASGDLRTSPIFRNGE